MTKKKRNSKMKKPRTIDPGVEEEVGRSIGKAIDHVESAIDTLPNGDRRVQALKYTVAGLMAILLSGCAVFYYDDVFETRGRF